MSAYDIAKDLSKIAATANLGKDVIDLLEKKLTLLTEEMSSLQNENLSLREHNENLKKENDDLSKRIHSLTSDEFPTEEQKKILWNLAKLDTWLTSSDIAGLASISKTKADYYLGSLEKRRWVSATHYYTEQQSQYHIADPGREYLIVHNLID
jgi:FtsZ-binding cell division protein ZapB